jgi:hypothetical protein
LSGPARANGSADARQRLGLPAALVTAPLGEMWVK